MNVAYFPLLFLSNSTSLIQTLQNHNYTRGDFTNDDPYIGYILAHQDFRILGPEYFKELIQVNYTNFITRTRLFKDLLYVFLGKISKNCDVWWYFHGTDQKSQVIFCEAGEKFEYENSWEFLNLDSILKNFDASSIASVTETNQIHSTSQITTTELERLILNLKLLFFSSFGLSILLIILTLIILSFCGVYRFVTGKYFCESQIKENQGFTC